MSGDGGFLVRETMGVAFFLGCAIQAAILVVIAGWEKEGGRNYEGQQ